MAKRMTDTNKYKKPFFRGLPGPYKLLWDFLYHDCDHAGIWIVDFEITQLYLGNDMPVNKEDALKYFNADEQRIIVLNSGSKWFIPSFIEFQYGELSEANRVHQSIIQILNKYNINIKGLANPLQGDKDKAKDKDKDKDKEKDTEERARKFKDLLAEHTEYTPEMLKAFFDYWTEPNKSKTKLRFELQETWDLKRRLATWASRDKDFVKQQEAEKKRYYKPPVQIRDEKILAEEARIKAQYEAQKKKNTPA